MVEDDDKKNNSVILQPDYSLKNEVGNLMHTKDILNDKVVQKAEIKVEENIADARNVHYLESYDNVRLLKSACASLKADNNNSEALAEIVGISLNIKSKSGLFGYNLAEKFATSLYSFARRINHVDEKIITVLESYVNGLEIIFSRKITNSENEAAQELLAEYDEIIQKERDIN